MHGPAHDRAAAIYDAIDAYLAPEEGEAALPRDAGEALARIRRVDDPQAVEVTIRAAAACTFGGIFEKL